MGSRPRSRTKKESRPISSVLSSRESSWKMDALFPTTTFRRNPLFISSFVFAADSKFGTRSLPRAANESSRRQGTNADSESSNRASKYEKLDLEQKKNSKKFIVKFTGIEKK